MYLTSQTLNHPSLQTLNHPSFLSGNSLCRGKPNSAAPSHISSVQLNDENRKYPESIKNWGSASVTSSTIMGCQSSTSLLTQPNTIGVIGGLSVLPTLIFLEKLASWSSRNGQESIPFVVCSSDLVISKVLLPSHSSLPFVKNRVSHIKLNQGLVIEDLKRKSKLLQDSGARALVMPCQVSHAWHGKISENCSVPFLHVGDCVALEVKKAKLETIHAKSTVRIGVLTTDEILVASYYKEKLQSQGFEVVFLDKATEEHILVPAVEALNRKDMEGARNLLRIAIHVLLFRAVNLVILASDDLLGILPHDDPLMIKCIDPMDALVRSTILWAQSSKRVN